MNNEHLTKIRKSQHRFFCDDALELVKGLLLLPIPFELASFSYHCSERFEIMASLPPHIAIVIDHTNEPGKLSLGTGRLQLQDRLDLFSLRTDSFLVDDIAEVINL